MTLPNMDVFESCELEEYDLYYIVYALKSLSKEKRKKLKSVGYKLQRHSRTNEEIWIFDKDGVKND